MADFAPLQTKQQASSLSKEISTSNGFASKNVYQDVFGGGVATTSNEGMLCFSSRVEDYTEIFTSCNSSRASSIPFLDLPLVVDDDQTDFSRSHCDYSEIFGGFDSLDYAVPYEDLFFEAKVDPSSPEDVWTPAETGSPSEESSEDPVSSENNQAFSNAESHYGYDDVKQFNMSYQKTNQISKEDEISGITHISQLNAVPAFTLVVDENLPLHTKKFDSSLHDEVNDRSLNVNTIDCRMDGEHFWETSSTQVSCGSDQKSQNLDGKGTHNEKPFVIVSEISLRTQPCEVPPPSRPPPKLTIKHGYHKSATSNLKYSSNYTRQGATNDCSPPFYDVEVDSGSSAAASAAAMKEAMEIAQARLKSAKELMERKKDGLQYRKKMGLNDCKSDGISDGGITHDVRVKEDKSHIKPERKGSDFKGFDRVERVKSMEDAHETLDFELQPRLFNLSKEYVEHKHPKEYAAHEALDFELQPRLFNLSKEYVEHKHPKECKLTQESQRQEVIGEWKAEEQFHELVQNDRIGRAFIAADNKSSKNKLIPITTTYKHGQNEMQAEKVAFVQQEKSDGRLHEVKMACELEEDMKRFNVANEVGEREEYRQTTKAVQKICDQEEHEKRQNESCELKEFEKLNEICAQEDYEKKLNETHEQEKKECDEQEEYLKKLKEAHVKKQNVCIELDENEKKMKESLQQADDERIQREACEREEFEREREDFERGESERRQKEVREKEENEKRINENRQMESRQREENEKRQQEACEREETGRRLKESQERQETERNLEQATEESERRPKEIGEMEEKERRQKVIEMEEYELFLTDSSGRQENECKAKQSAVESEWELQSVHEKEENGRREKEECEREENENKLKVSCGREEIERKLKQAAEENERRLNGLQEREKNNIRDSHNHEENDKRLEEPFEDEVIEKLLQKETCEWVDNEKKLRDSQALKEKRPEESCKCKNQNIELEKASGQEEIKKRHSKAFEGDDIDQYELSQDFHISEENKNLKVDTLYVEVAEQKEELMAHGDVCMQDEAMNLKDTRGGWEQEEYNDQLTMVQESCREESDNIMKIAQNAPEHIEMVKNFKVDEVSYELDKIERLRAVNMAQGCSAECENNQAAALKAKVDDSKKESGNIENTVIEEKDDQCMKEVPAVLNFKDTRKSVQTSQRMGQSVEDGMKIEVVHSITEEEKRTNQKLADQFNTNQERKDNNLNGTVAREVNGKEGRIKDREQERERLKKLEEDRLREREREKDRIAVERVTREARERAFAETRERAERAAVERATAEVRQRAMLEARERLEKACAEAREKSLAEKAYTESRLRAERAAVERATSEARERAVEKAMAERAAMEARVDRSVSEKFSAVSRDRDLRHSASFSDVRNAHFQSSSSFSSSQRYPNSSNHSAFTNEKSQGAEVESAQRCKAKSERHQRTVERAAKALAEKNLRDHLAQREQAERNRLADTLDADVRRWSSGKEGNLRALLSTLQYILGPESGWQPIPLTDVITAVAVKKAYRKATLCVHPDKLQQRGASIQQKYICEKVFDLLKDAWSKFNSEER